MILIWKVYARRQPVGYMVFKFQTGARGGAVRFRNALNPEYVQRQAQKIRTVKITAVKFLGRAQDGDLARTSRVNKRFDSKG